jgi:uncharacterized cofD-like protein
VVALGGGNGLPVVLGALRRYLPSECRITAIVTTADNGGSSGLLRTEYGVLPPGDIRNCLVALAHVAPEISAALQYRFDGGSAQHPVGNLFLAALDMVAADEVTAIRLAADLLGVKDLVLPSTTRLVHLIADLVDGRSVHGESEIPLSGGSIERIRVHPSDVTAAPGVVEALEEADAVILGPGSLYTSVLATIVVPGVAEAIRNSGGVNIFVCNAMTECGETDGYDVADHVRAVAAHGVPAEELDYVIVNTGTIGDRVLARYAAENAMPVEPFVEGLGPRPIILRADVLESGPVVRHAADKLGPILCDLIAGRPPAPPPVATADAERARS